SDGRAPPRRGSAQKAPRIARGPAKHLSQQIPVRLMIPIPTCERRIIFAAEKVFESWRFCMTVTKDRVQPALMPCLRSFQRKAQSIVGYSSEPTVWTDPKVRRRLNDLFAHANVRIPKSQGVRWNSDLGF